MPATVVLRTYVPAPVPYASRRGCRYITRTYGIVGGVPMGGDGFVEVSHRGAVRFLVVG